MADKLLSDVGALIGTDIKRLRESIEVLDADSMVQNNAAMPHSGDTQFNEYDKAFLFAESVDNIAKVVVTNEYTKIGDTVVDTYGPELVTNGDFNNGLTGFSPVNDSVLSLTPTWQLDAISSSYSNEVVSFPCVIEKGNSYAISMYVGFNVHSSFSFRVNGNYIGANQLIGQGYITAIFVAETSGTYIVLAGGSSNSHITIDNISVKETTTVDMESFIPEVVVQDQATDGLTTQVDVASGDYVVVDRDGSTTEEVYRNETDSILPSGSDIPSTFTNRDDLPISNQVLACHTMDIATKTYDGVTNHILMNDAIAGETTQSIVLRNGFSKVSDGLYSKGDKSYTTIGYFQTDNNGRHSNNGINPKGQFAAIDGEDWYASAFPSATMADAFSNVGAVVRKPDVTIANTIRKAQWIDLREYSFKANKLVLDRMREDKKFNGVGGLTEFKGLYVQVATSTASQYIKVSSTHASDAGFVQEELITVYIYESDIKVLVDAKVIAVQSDGYIRVEGLSYNRVNGESVAIAKTINNNSTGTQLKTELIGAPGNYPTDMTDRLAEGKSLFGINPLLVDDLGNSLIPDGTIDDFKMSSKFNYMHSTIRTVDSGINWTPFAPVSNAVDNKNTYTNEPSANVLLSQYTSQNNPLNVADALPIIPDGVKEKVISTTSHSISKGAIYGNMINKVQTGNTGKGLESDYLRNVNLLSAINLKVNEAITVVQGSYYFVDSNDYILENQYGVYERIAATDLTVPTSVWEFSTTSGWNFIGISTTPEHSVTTLVVNTPASKFFQSFAVDADGYVCDQIMMEELVGDGDTGDFSQLTNGTKEDFRGNTVRTVVASTSLGIRE